MYDCYSLHPSRHDERTAPSGAKNPRNRLIRRNFRAMERSRRGRITERTYEGVNYNAISLFRTIAVRLRKPRREKTFKAGAGSGHARGTVW
jgi:hypothetical protein